MKDKKKKTLKPLNTVDSNYQSSNFIESIWGKFDTDNSGALDKLETQKFLNEFMKLKGKPGVTINQFNTFFKKFDENGDGEIEKGEMAKFIQGFMQEELL